MSVVRLRPGQSEGTVAARTRVSSGDAGRPKDAESGAPGRLLTLPDVAERCAVSVWTVRAWVDNGKLPVLRLPGRLVRVEPAALDALLERCR